MVTGYFCQRALISPQKHLSASKSHIAQNEFGHPPHYLHISATTFCGLFKIGGLSHRAFCVYAQLLKESSGVLFTSSLCSFRSDITPGTKDGSQLYAAHS